MTVFRGPPLLYCPKYLSYPQAAFLRALNPLKGSRGLEMVQAAICLHVLDDIRIL